MFEIGRLTRLDLGYEGESNARQIEIRVADWLSDWPGATIGLLLQRPGEDDFYPAVTTVADGVLKYTPTRADVEIPGEGLAQIVMTDDNDVELRSRVVQTKIKESLPGSSADAPEAPMQPFVTQVLEAAARAEEQAERAKDEADRAEEAAGNSGGDPAGAAVAAVNAHNADAEAHPHIQEMINEIKVPTKVSQLENDSGYLTEHQDISGLLPRTELDTAIDTALAEAKASGEFDGADGEDGYTPVKGTDYYTAADKDEMVQAVIAALPVYGGEVGSA